MGPVKAYRPHSHRRFTGVSPGPGQTPVGLGYVARRSRRQPVPSGGADGVRTPFRAGLAVPRPSIAAGSPSEQARERPKSCPTCLPASRMSGPSDSALIDGSTVRLSFLSEDVNSGFPPHRSLRRRIEIHGTFRALSVPCGTSRSGSVPSFRCLEDASAQWVAQGGQGRVIHFPPNLRWISVD